ncbi:glycosyltransferase family protein [Sphingomonas prati]|uniref:Uncharacterized protein n=1 Tax=Sphingomonas prati TaxID=1843237 RepID=A0A7W9BTU3_9SPHN|nr:hypothetical protein [Sphingomonas prati]MBB5730004.1 hypothetical protein [Sphingomonas prati]GGE90656.1 hypothetical protein GCM10011404_24530 [Sphingomonas prati]
MALAALIIAIETTTGEAGTGGDGLRATLPLLGRTVVEHQARQAVGAGATHLVLLVERMPAALTAALDRLRRDGVSIEVARTIGDAADRFHPDERLLLIADGCVADPAMFGALTRLPPPVLMTVPDQADTAEYERIDGQSRWAGLGLLDGAAVRSTAAMLGDWDAQSTLLRRAVQAGASRVECAPAADGRPRIAIRPQALDGLDRHLLRGSRVSADRWPRRWVFSVVDGPVAGWLARKAVDPLPVAAAGAGAAGLGVVVMLAGWLATGFGLVLLSGPVAAIAARLARLRLATIRHGDRIERARTAMLAAGLVVLGWSLGADLWLLTAVMAVAAMVAGASARQGLAALSGESGPAWVADPDGLACAMAPVAIAFGWKSAVAAALAYALLSFARMQTLFVAGAQDNTPDVNAPI